MEENNPEVNQDNPDRSTFKQKFLRAFWLALVVFFGQNAWASVYENEGRAGIIYASFSLLIFFGGIIYYLARKLNF